jgi:hypothetical protein
VCGMMSDDDDDDHLETRLVGLFANAVEGWRLLRSSAAIGVLASHCQCS